MRRSTLTALLILATVLPVAACGSSSAKPSQPGGRVLLAGNYVTNEVPGYDIRTGAIIDHGNDSARIDFYLSMTMIISLFPPTLQTGRAGFCLVPGTFMEVAAIPIDGLAGCAWGLADLGGNSIHAQSNAAGRGYLVKDRDGVFAAKLLIISDSADDQGGVQVTFDIDGVSGP